MPLFEASWTDGSSYLVSATNMGHAIYLLQKHIGPSRLYELTEMVDIGCENFTLIRKCGDIRQPLPSISFRHCPEAKPRIFFAESQKDPKRSVFVVESIKELPALVLPHYDLLKESETKNQEVIFEKWQEHSPIFSFVELDTQKPGILLHYDYCCCHQERNQILLTHQESDALEKPH